MSAAAPDPSSRIAVVGLDVRVPGASSASQFWENLRNGVESIELLSDDELASRGVPESLRRAPGFVPAHARLDEADRFDASYFGFSPREAEVMDPQLRVFLESAVTALEHAGHDPGQFEGSIGVVAGVGASDYYIQNVLPLRSRLGALDGVQVRLSNASDSLPTMVSYKLDLGGPSFTAQTACSSSLTAVHLACQSLLNGECDVMLAGGVTIWGGCGYVYQPGGILSRDGHCRAFDAGATGTVPGSGVGIVVLKRLEDALAASDTVHAVILGSAMNNDGASKAGYTAPSVTGHAKVVTEALAVANVTADTLGYVEAHGTGTEVGDPVEIEGLTLAFRESTSEVGFCSIGSVKTNIGHLDHAAGVVSLIKTVLALSHRQIPPSLHFERANPRIDFQKSPFVVADALREWPSSNRAPRRAGVTSLGIGGTNAHVILEEAPPPRELPKEVPAPQLVVLSARSETALAAAADRLAIHLRANPEAALSHVSYTLHVGRRRFGHRLALVADSTTDLLERLDPSRSGSNGSLRAASPYEASEPVFLFPGQGTQYPRMMEGLYRRYEGLRQTVDSCSRRLEPLLGRDVRDVLYPAPGRDDWAAGELLQTALAQPALFVVEYALARLWMSWGVVPKAMIGHSIGELVAATLASVFTLEEALELVAVRGRLMQALAGGAMLALDLDETELSACLSELELDLDLAAVNAPRGAVVSGSAEAVDCLEAVAFARGIAAQRLHTSHAFHSRMMDPAVSAFAEAVRGVRRRPPAIPFVSNVSGTWIRPEQAESPEYWGRHLRETVRFGDGIAQVLHEDELVLLEVGPGGTLRSLASQSRQRKPTHRIVSSTRQARENVPDDVWLLRAAGQLWLAGVRIDGDAFHAGQSRVRARVPLPTYPFERRRYWLDPASGDGPALRRDASAAAPVRSSTVAEWLYAPLWTSRVNSRPRALEPGAPSRWLVATGEHPLGESLVSRLRELGHDVIELARGSEARLERDPAGERFVVRPAEREDYDGLVRALAADGRLPDRIAHLWTLDAGTGDGDSYEAEAVELGLESISYLCRALGESATESTHRLFVVTSGVESLDGAERVTPENAMVAALCPVIRQEYPSIEASVVDLARSIERIDIDRVLAELHHDGKDAFVALRGSLRHVLTYAPIESRGTERAPAERSPLKRHGVYLITGGLGRLGSTVAEHLAREVQAKLVLVSRSGLPERSRWDDFLAADVPNVDVKAKDEALVRARLQSVLRMESLGSEVLVLSTDVSDAGRMREAWERAEARFGRVDGVIHAAGALDGGTLLPLSSLTRAECLRQFAPKVRALYVLDELLESRSVDFVLLMSSLSAILGGVGYGVYAAANRFMDAFVVEQHRRGKTFWTSVQWDGWDTSEGGRETTSYGSELSRLALSRAEGVAALERILALDGEPRVAVSTADLVARLARWSSFEPVDTAEGRGPLASSLERHPRPELHTVYAAPVTEIEARLAELWGELLGLDRVGIHDNFFELGGSSLLAIQLVARLQKQAGIQVPTAIVFEGPTVHSLSRLLETRAREAEDTAERVARG